MNPKKIAFIICANNALYYEECVRYLEDLEVPEGYETDIICIQEAASMAGGYNAGMNNTDAKYKVYLHQDVFVKNTKLIYDILHIFEGDSTIGMIGVLGSRKLRSDANCYLWWLVGCVEAYDGFKIADIDYLFQRSDMEYIPVMAIDGMIMITQYDVQWREDFLDGWDFYDISQSLEMRQRGYQVVVPYQKSAWCYHDCGVSKLDKYDYYRKKMLEHYPDVFGGSIDEKEADIQKAKREKIYLFREGMIELLEKGAYLELEEVSETAKENNLLDTQIREITNLMEIWRLEEDSVSENHSVWYDYDNWTEIYDSYKWVGFVLKRLEWGRKDERIAELKGLVDKGRISRDAVYKIAAATIKSPEKYDLYFGEKPVRTPLVSIVISVHNGEDFVAQTLDSVLAQTYREWEMIIVDDASEDASKEIIAEYAERDGRIKPLFLEKNVHVCAAVNKAIEFASGEYIADMGHDDLWRADKLEKQVAFLEEHPAYGACFTWADIVNEEGNCINLRESDLYKKFCAANLKRKNAIHKLITQKNYFCAPSVLIRRSCLEEVGFYRYALVQLQDYDLWLRILRISPVYILQEKLTFYRRFQTQKNLSAGTQAIYNRDMHEMQWIIENYIKTMSDEEFLEVFWRDLRNAGSSTTVEIACEKAFLLWNLGNCFAEKWFIEMMEDKEIRELLEEKYQYSLLDFYRQNSEPMHFDNPQNAQVLEG